MRDFADSVLLSHDPPPSLRAAPYKRRARTVGNDFSLRQLEPGHELEGRRGKAAIDKHVRPVGYSTAGTLEAIEGASQ